MKKFILFTLCLILSVSLLGCSNYVSSYSAVALVRSNERDSAYMTFYSFEGTMIFKLKCKDETSLKYSASLESGSATVYYDMDGTKTELFSLCGGDTAESTLEGVKSGTVYIIIEANGTCQSGDLHFGLE